MHGGLLLFAKGLHSWSQGHHGMGVPWHLVNSLFCRALFLLDELPLILMKWWSQSCLLDVNLRPLIRIKVMRNAR
jgi:hypothetical protein